jgi:hypothetical protein
MSVRGRKGKRIILYKKTDFDRLAQRANIALSDYFVKLIINRKKWDFRKSTP